MSVLTDLLFGVRVQDGETGVNVPFLGVDSESQVDLDILNTTDISSDLPRKLSISMPGFTHTKEGGMGDSLSICCDAVMLCCGEIDVSGAKTRKHMLDFVEALLGCSMLDQNLERVNSEMPVVPSCLPMVDL